MPVKRARAALPNSRVSLRLWYPEVSLPSLPTSSACSTLPPQLSLATSTGLWPTGIPLVTPFVKHVSTQSRHFGGGNRLGNSHRLRS
jgi:hypothetical protein